VHCRQADALDLPYADNCFDAVFMFHLNMNIADKAALFAEVRRVLKPGCRMALWEICQGAAQPGIVYPVPWAADASFSYLVSPPEFMQIIRAAGFRDLQIEDATGHALQWVRERMASPPKKTRPKPLMDLDPVMPDFRLRRSNINKNLISGCVRILRGLAAKAGVHE
jgi:SAM-dependent methyltransferase